MGSGKGWSGLGRWLGGGIMLRGSMSAASDGTGVRTGAGAAAALLGHSKKIDRCR